MEISLSPVYVPQKHKPQHFHSNVTYLKEKETMLFRNKHLYTLILELISSFMLCFSPVNARNKTVLEKKEQRMILQLH